MKKRKPRYRLTWYTELSNGYVDVRTITLMTKHTAKIMYNKIASEPSTLSIELEEF